MNTPPTTVVGARVQQHHAEQLRQIADKNASTISRTVGRIVAEVLDGKSDTDSRRPTNVSRTENVARAS